jgi:XTP/dITP diphosphohydrolase
MTETENKPRLILASRNQKKIQEIHALLMPHGIAVTGVGDFPDVPDVVEDRDTFQGNAEKKASETALQLKSWTLAEDSGLAVDALNGEPGVYSARYAGETGTREERDRRNNEKLIEALKNVPPDKRTAHYVCHVAVADPSGAIRLNVEATCRGRVIETPRGSNGFGYDPYFLLPEYHRTFGELSSLVKNQLSHRARAFERLLPRLISLLKNPS